MSGKQVALALNFCKVLILSTNRPRSVKCVAEKSSLQGVGNQRASEGGKYVGHILKFLGPILNYVP